MVSEQVGLGYLIPPEIHCSAAAGRPATVRRRGSASCGPVLQPPVAARVRAWPVAAPPCLTHRPPSLLFARPPVAVRRGRSPSAARSGRPPSAAVAACYRLPPSRPAAVAHAARRGLCCCLSSAAPAHPPARRGPPARPLLQLLRLAPLLWFLCCCLSCCGRAAVLLFRPVRPPVVARP